MTCFDTNKYNDIDIKATHAVRSDNSGWSYYWCIDTDSRQLKPNTSISLLQRGQLSSATLSFNVGKLPVNIQDAFSHFTPVTRCIQVVLVSLYFADVFKWWFSPLGSGSVLIHKHRGLSHSFEEPSKWHSSLIHSSLGAIFNMSHRV